MDPRRINTYSLFLTIRLLLFISQPPPPPKTRRGRDKRAVNPKYLVDAETGQQVWISAISLQDIQSAKKRKTSPWGTQPRLVTVDSEAQRNAVYKRAAKALAELEGISLPLYGGRPWTCHVTVNESKGLPYFCFGPDGLLELAAWPTILEKRPVPPKFPRHVPNTEFLPGDLKTREPSALSRLATNESWRVPVPSFNFRWISPLKETFHSRAAVWKHAGDLLKKEATIEKVLGGNVSKLQICSQKVALSTGKMRFERDGLWVVGQEEFWGRERLSGTTATVIIEPPPLLAKRRATGLSCFIESQRKEHQAKRLAELKAANGAPLKIKPEPLHGRLVTECKASPQHGSRVFEMISFESQGDTDQSSTSTASMVPKSNETESLTTLSESIGIPISATQQGSKPSLLPSDLPMKESVESSLMTPPNTWTPKRDPSEPTPPLTHGFKNVLQPHSTVQKDQMIIRPPATLSDISCERECQLIPHRSLQPVPLASNAPFAISTTKAEKPRTISFTLREAEIELRAMWKELPKEEQSKWNDEAHRRNPPDDAKESAVGIVSDESVDEGSKDLSSRSESPQTVPQLLSRESQPEEESAAQKAKEYKIWWNKKLVEFHRSRKWCLTQEQVQLCYKAGMDHYDQIMHTVKARDLSRELQDGFDMLRERGRGRFDMELNAFEEPTFSFFNVVQKAPWMPIVKTILGKEVVLIHKGIFLSMVSRWTNHIAALTYMCH